MSPRASVTSKSSPSLFATLLLSNGHLSLGTQFILSENSVTRTTFPETPFAPKRESLKGRPLREALACEREAFNSVLWRKNKSD